jgi:hypothetical protein
MSRIFAGRYQVVGALGGGGTALVHRARVLSGGADVAIKELRPQFAADAAIRRRFLREAELVRQLEHPGIVRCLDAGEDGEIPFVVMELAAGETLRQTLDRCGRLELTVARAVFVGLARALDYAHRCGVIHRDVKPQNIFVHDDRVQLADFGNARVVSLASVTGASLTWGTPEYVAPEVFTRGRADPRSDLYSAGVVLYEMLTGRLPWSRAETLTRLTGRARSAAFAPTGLDAGVDDLLRWLLAFEPADRPASGEEVIGRWSSVVALAAVEAIACPTCGAARGADIPRCFTCGVESLRLRQTPDGGWRLVLRRLKDDAATTEALLRLLGSIAQPVSGPLHFLTGNRHLYSEAERTAGIAVPAVLFSELDEDAARALDALFRQHGFDTVALAGTTSWVPYSTAPLPVVPAVFAVTMAGLVAVRMGAPVLVGCLVSAGTAAALAFHVLRKGRNRMRHQIGHLQLREQVIALPIADRLLADTAAGLAKIRAPETRRLVAEAASQVYRLSRRAEAIAGAGGPSSAAGLFQRTLAAAPGLMLRLQKSAATLDDLDVALEGQTEGEIMQALARLDRAAAAPDANRDTLAAARRELDAALKRRHAAEEERARLSAKLCHLLGRLRLLYLQAASMPTLEEREARALEAGSAELDAFLAPRPS